MIQILGMKRIVILSLVLIINLGLAAGVYLFLIPQNDTFSQQINSLTAQISGKRMDTEKLRSEYKEIQDEKVYLSYLGATGFFSDQNRVLARQRIDEIQKFTKVLSARYNIEAAKVETNDLADEAGSVVLASQVKINVEALDDVDLYNFVYWIENGFPGQVLVKSVDVSRSQDINEATLRQIATGGPMTLIQGTLTFEWRTMVPKTTVEAAGSGKASQ